MSYEIEFKTGQSSAKLDALIVKLNNVAKLSDTISSKQIGLGGTGKGTKFGKPGGAGKDDSFLTSAIKHLDSSIVRLNTTITSGAGKRALKGLGGQADSHVKAFKEKAAAEAKQSAQMLQRHHYVLGAKLKGIQTERAANAAMAAEVLRNHHKNTTQALNNILKKRKAKQTAHREALAQIAKESKAEAKATTGSARQTDSS